MQSWPNVSRVFGDNRRNLRVLKIVVVATPALFAVVLDLLRHHALQQTRPANADIVFLFMVILFVSFFFFEFVFAVINHVQGNRMQELETLNTVNMAVGEFHDRNALLNKAMSTLIDITNADCGELYVVDERSHDLMHAFHGGPQDDVPSRETQRQLTKRLMEESRRLNHAVVFENVGCSNEPEQAIASRANPGVSSIAVIPLQTRGRTVGAACLLSAHHDHFKPSQTQLLRNVGNRIAVAIDNACLYEKVQAVVVLEERTRISAELHDGLAQLLGYVITKSQATRQLLTKMAVATEYLAEIENAAQEVYTDTREAILGLSTAIRGDTNMVVALREYVARFNQMQGVNVEVIAPDSSIPSLPPQVELQAIRITQEALSNVRKHAEAARATIKVTAGDDAVSIAVVDDGKGFDIDEVENRGGLGFGLRNMKWRAASIGADLLVDSKPNEGTTVILCIPLTFVRAPLEAGGEIESDNS